MSLYHANIYHLPEKKHPFITVFLIDTVFYFVHIRHTPLISVHLKYASLSLKTNTNFYR